MYYRNFVLVFIISVFLISCNNENNNKESSTAQEQTQVVLTSFKTGGIYLLKDNNDSFYVIKILAIDDFAVHVRTYRNKFAERPKDINSAALTILIGHAPLAAEGLLADQPELLKVEEVKENELGGYKMYVEAMQQ